MDFISPTMGFYMVNYTLANAVKIEFEKVVLLLSQSEDIEC